MAQSCQPTYHAINVNSTLNNNVEFYTFMIYPNCHHELNVSVLLNTTNLDEFGDSLFNSTNSVSWYVDCNLSGVKSSVSCYLNYHEDAAIALVFVHRKNLTDAPNKTFVLEEMANHFVTLLITSNETEIYNEDFITDLFGSSTLTTLEYDEESVDIDNFLLPTDFYANIFECGQHATCSLPCAVRLCYSGFCALSNNTQGFSHKTSDHVCRASAGLCDHEETCTGNSSECPPNVVFAELTVCRPSVGTCDIEEMCDGLNNDCPPDTFESSSFVCRQAVGSCDVVESCTGDSTECPEDTYFGFFDFIECRPSAGPCDTPEICDGFSANCPENMFETSQVICRDSTGACDMTERCDGEGPTCPNDQVASTNVVCRNASGACDLAENCTGTTKFCPAQTYKASGVVCRPAVRSQLDNTTCDVEEVCDGLGPHCPTDGFLESGVMCRSKNGDNCDIEERCNGNSSSCPPNIQREYIYLYQCQNNLYVCGLANLPMELNIHFAEYHFNQFHLFGRSFTNVRHILYLPWPRCITWCYNTTEDLCKNNDPLPTVHFVEAECIHAGENSLVEPDSQSLTLSLPPSSTHGLTTREDLKHVPTLEKVEHVNEKSFTMANTMQLSQLKEAITRRQKTNSHTSTTKHIVNDHGQSNSQHSGKKVHTTINGKHQRRSLESTTVEAVSWRLIHVQNYVATHLVTNSSRKCPIWIENNTIDVDLYNFTETLLYNPTPNQQLVQSSSGNQHVRMINSLIILMLSFYIIFYIV